MYMCIRMQSERTLMSFFASAWVMVFMKYLPSLLMKNFCRLLLPCEHAHHPK